MSQGNKIIITALIAALIAGGGVYIWQTNLKPISPANETVQANEWEELIGYNCELSGGLFSDNNCECPIEEAIGQTQEEIYDKNSGYCKTTMGAPGGDAFAASVGLPWGNYSNWSDIVGANCTETAGSWLNANCTCSGETSYDEETGYCE
ncbi:hypothetical protein HOD30_02585 [Candidatus Peregrinibacteria bacterium]|jgi:hypothetical protein|nr:hypothetical protein [Candidatus Peregrinibacteria bacterium]MBT4631555.1 hypothetical protein [Candidatus Peregrinibacteria bacterium]MBT5823540.1 hypothetical protein [Candidatus Peregrinibacteria bacterium]